MDVININVTEGHIFECLTDTIARAGEADNLVLNITFPKRFEDRWPYLDFKKPNGERFRSEKLVVEGNAARYVMPLYLLDTDGTLEVQFVSQDDSGLVWKTYVKKFDVKYSINAVDEIPEKEDFVAGVQKSIDDMEKTIEVLRKEGVTGAVLFGAEQELNDHQKWVARLNIGAYDVPVFINGNDQDGYTSSMTYDEMVNALNFGQTLVCVFGEVLMPLLERNKNDLHFMVTILTATCSVIVSKDGNDTVVVVETTVPSIQIGDEQWNGAENNTVDFTDTINGMIDGKVQTLGGDIADIREELQAHERDADKAFVTVDAELQSLNQKVAGIDVVNEDLQTHKKGTDEAFAAVENEFQTLNQKVAGVDAVNEDLQTFKGETNTALSRTETELQALNDVAAELSKKVDGASSKPWQLIADYTLTEPSPQVEITPNGKYAEVYIECAYKIETDETSAKSILFGVGRAGNYITRNTVSVKNGDTVYYRAWGKISPSKRAIFDAVASNARFANMASNCGDPTATNIECFDSAFRIRLHTNSATHQFGVDSTIKVWGR